MKSSGILQTSVLILSLAGRPALAQNGGSHGGLSIEAIYRVTADSLIHAATSDSAAYVRLGNLVDGFGPRLSGSSPSQS